MNPERWHQIDSLLEAALEREPGERAPFLDQACAGDEGLRREVEALLESDRRGTRFIESPAVEVAAPLFAGEQADSVMQRPIGPYQVIARLGAGGMGEVYLAHDPKLGRKVALKLLPSYFTVDDQRVRRFRQEARAASALNHPNIVTIHDIEEVEGRHYIAMEYVEGKTLRQVMVSGRMGLEQGLDVAVQVASALAAAHRAGIVHRDIKPENVMVRPDGYVKVLDFGLAKLSEPQAIGIEPGVPAAANGQATSRIETDPGTVMGTANYMSPEQARGEEVDQRTDVFSLGVMLYEMTTGTSPFEGKTPALVFDAILNQAPVPPTTLSPELPLELELIISKALEKDREMRHQTASDLRTDLRRLKRDTDSGRAAALTPPAPTVRWRLARRLAGPIAAATLALLLLWLIPSSRDAVKKWLALETLAAEKHLVVLPFTNVGNDPTNQAFCDGLAETLTDKLTQLEQFHESLWVVHTSEAIQGKITSPSQAQRNLGVNLVVTGSVQREGDRVRLILKLVEAKTGRELKSSLIDDRMPNVFGLQDDAAIKLTKMLELELQPKIVDVLTAGGTTVPSANDYYVQGRGYLVRYEKRENLDTAIALFERALKEDSRFALAYAGLGEAYWRKYDASKDMQWIQQAVSNCEQALKLNDQLSPVHVTLGLVRAGRGRYEEAVQDFKHALELDSRSADAYRELAKVYEDLRKFEQAENTNKQAIKLWPSYWAGYNNLGKFYFRQSRYEEAITQFRQVVALTPQNIRGYVNIGSVFFLQKRWPEAREMFERSLHIEPTYQAYLNLGTVSFYEKRYTDAARMYEKALEINNLDYSVWGKLASAYQQAPGEAEKAQATYQRAAQIAEEQRKVNPRDPRVLCDLADYYGVIGERAKALALLAQTLSLAPDDRELMFRAGHIYEDLHERQRALECIGKALALGYSRVEIESAPGLEQLRADPRFRDLPKHR